MLCLADGSSWRIMAGEPEALPVVATLAAIMRLPLATGTDRPVARRAVPTRDVHVIVRNGPEAQEPPPSEGDGPLVVAVFPSVDPATHTIAVTRVADAVARDVLDRGGLLVHGALSEFKRRGVLLAAASTTGKTTASRRLMEPWRSWSDDATLIVRDPQGELRAHPWPTWSRFYEEGGEGNWDVAASLPLDLLCFLSQAAADELAPIRHGAQTVALLMDCVTAMSMMTRRDLDDRQANILVNKQLFNVEAIVPDIPAYTLRLSLAGDFWTLLEPLLDTASPATRETKRRASSRKGRESFFVALRGTSMLPSLREPALLEVANCHGSSLRSGDVVCFRAPQSGFLVVHRVASTGPLGIRTRGDNSSRVDPYVVRPEEVLGRVVAAHRGSKRRHVAGGKLGRAFAATARLRRTAGRIVSFRLHGAYEHLADNTTCQAVWSCLAPGFLRPRLIGFGDSQNGTTKALLGRITIGQCDRLLSTWTIRRPFRLIVSQMPPCPPPGLPPASTGPQGRDASGNRAHVDGQPTDRRQGDRRDGDEP